MKRIIFIDRDGVINKDPGGWTKYSYVTKWEDFIFLPNSIEALKKLNSAGYNIVVISNQAGVGKGYYSEETLKDINKMMLKEVEKAGAKITKTYYCIHRNEDNCNCRKPKTGLFEEAKKDFSFDTANTFFIGDGKTDIEAGDKVGLKTILLLSGKTDHKDVDDWPVKPDFIFDNLLKAVDFIIKEGG